MRSDPIRFGGGADDGGADFLHDRAVRESGHDTTYRFEKRCANLGTIDLCSLLYKYEVDIATTIRDHFDDDLELVEEFSLSKFPFGADVPYDATGSTLPDLSGERSSTTGRQSSAEWFARAARRKELADHYLWHEGHGLYTDLDTVTGKQSLYDTVRSFLASGRGWGLMRSAGHDVLAHVGGDGERGAGGEDDVSARFSRWTEGWALMGCAGLVGRSRCTSLRRREDCCRGRRARVGGSRCRGRTGSGSEFFLSLWRAKCC